MHHKIITGGKILQKKNNLVMQSIYSMFIFVIILILLKYIVAGVAASNGNTNYHLVVNEQYIASIMRPPTAVPIDFKPNEIIISPYQKDDFNIAEQIDLARDKPDKEKYVYIVKKFDDNNTYYIEFLVPIDLTDDLRVYLQLKDEDVIVNGWPLIPPKSFPIFISTPQPKYKETTREYYWLSYPPIPTLSPYP